MKYKIPKINITATLTAGSETNNVIFEKETPLLNKSSINILVANITNNEPITVKAIKEISVINFFLAILHYLLICMIVVFIA